MSGFRERVGTPTTCNQSPLCFGDVPNTLGYPPGEGPWGAPVRSPTSQAKMLGPPSAPTAALQAFLRALSHSLSLEGGCPSLFRRPAV